MVNLQERLDSLDVFRKVTGLRLQMSTISCSEGLDPRFAATHDRHAPGDPPVSPEGVRLLAALWEERRPDMVVSLVPNFNRALCESLGRALPAVPFVTILTDIADYPPHFWIEKQKQYLICGSAAPSSRPSTWATPNPWSSGLPAMILNPRFYETPPLADEQRREARRALGFDPLLPWAWCCSAVRAPPPCWVSRATSPAANCCSSAATTTSSARA